MLLSKCAKSAVVREGGLDALAGTYDPAPGGTLMIIIREGLDTDADIKQLLANITANGRNISYTEKSRDISRGREIITYSLTEAF